jgi:hypothetical protein
MRLCSSAVMILPQMDLPFRYSGEQCHTWLQPENYTKAYARFHQRFSDVDFEAGCIDTTQYKDEWQGVSPRVELVRVQRNEGLAEPLGLDWQPPKWTKKSKRAEADQEPEPGSLEDRVNTKLQALSEAIMDLAEPKSLTLFEL